MSDIHLGFQKNEELQRIEQEVFETTLDRCIELAVDFVLIPGDMFHVNIPEMRVQRFAFAKFRQVYDAGIPVYVVYGSHDFSPVSNSVIDLLAEVGYITKVTKPKSNEDGSISLEFLVDKKTGVKIAGLPGLKVGGDRIWYDNLDRESLEAESGFKIFLFHGGIAEMKTDTSIDGEHMPLSLLPRGFAYYAGGHMHKENYQKFPEHPHVAYPGTIFAGYYADLEENARGQRRGFFLVEFEDEVKSVKFEEIKNTEYAMIEVDAKNRTAQSVNQELQKKTSEIKPEGKVVIVRVAGEMTSGKTADVDTSLIRDRLSGSGSLVVNISRSMLRSKEYQITGAKGSNRDEVETNVFSENIGQLRFDYKELLDENGISLAKRLLRETSQGQMANEKKNDYATRIGSNALAILGLDRDDSKQHSN